MVILGEVTQMMAVWLVKTYRIPVLASPTPAFSPALSACLVLWCLQLTADKNLSVSIQSVPYKTTGIEEQKMAKTGRLEEKSDKPINIAPAWCCLCTLYDHDGS